MVAFAFTLLGWRIGGYSGGGRMGSGSPVVKGYSSGLFFAVRQMGGASGK
jgi:hypothetical protein